MSDADEVTIKLRLREVGKFIADIKSGKLAVEDLEKSIDKTDHTARKASGTGGGLGMLSRAGRLGGIALGGIVTSAAAAGAGVLGFGIKAASSAEQAQIGFTTMLGSAKRAKAMLGDLSDFAQKTPFELAGLRSTASMMLGMGFGAKEIIPDLTAVGDAMSGLGRGADDVNGVTMALGQMKAHGIADAGDLLQLTSRGINSWQIMADKMHKSIPQIQDMVSKGLIPANDAISMIIDGMENGTKHTQKFGGMMDKQSKSLSGIWSNAKDAASRAATALVQPLMPGLKRGGLWLTGQIPKAQKWATRTGTRIHDLGSSALTDLRAGNDGGAANAISGMFGGKAGGQASQWIEKAITSGRNLTQVWKQALWPALKDVGTAFKEVMDKTSPLVGVLKHMDGITGFLAKHTTALHGIILTVVTGLVTYKTTVGTIQVVTKTWAAAQRLLNLAMTMNPIGLVIAGIAALVVGLIYAYRHSERFRAIVDGAMHGAKVAIGWVVDKAESLWGWIEKVGSGAGEKLSGIWDGLKSGFKAAINWIIGGWNNLHFKMPEVDTHIPGVGKVGGFDIGVPQIPLLATGGIITGAGTAMVGENGPEVLSLPRGASVIPLPRASNDPGRSRQVPPIDVTLMLDGQVLMRRIISSQDTALARL